MIKLPEGLHPSTAALVEGFATALAEKLRRSEIKYGWSDGWKDADWQDKCLADFNHHIDKGDPRDFAAYCAFMWFHGWQTKRLNANAQPVSAQEWTNEQCLEFLTIAFRHVDISGDIEMDDIRLGIRMVNAAAPGGQDD